MRHHNFLKSAKAALAAFVLATLGATQAHAVDGKNYPGSMCVPWGANRTPTYYYSAIGNPSTSTDLLLDCPIVRDSITNTIQSGWVKAIDQHYYDNVSCRLDSIYFSGGAAWGWSSPTLSSSGSSGNPQHLAFGGVGANNTAHYYYSCRIPPTFNGNVSSITSYQVNEN
jgi:hypothetical protein